jgi:hypothetical protein
VSKKTASLLAMVAIIGTLARAAPIAAQQAVASASDPLILPNAPTAQISANQTSADYSSSLSDPDAAPSSQQQTTAPPSQSPQAVTPQTPETPEQHKARHDAELKAEEQQRMLGFLPAFNSVIGGKAEPMTPGEKFHLFFKGIIDPYQFAIVAVDTGLQEAQDSYPGYHHGIPGLLRNYGAAYADDFDGNFWGNAVLPSLLHQDPRYFRLGHGTFRHRLIYSMETTVRTKGDNGKWEPNYSNVLGNLIGGAISNVYYPAANRGVGLTIDHGLTVTAEGAVGAFLLEFYPDFAQHMKNRRAQKAAAADASSPATTTPPQVTTQPH